MWLEWPPPQSERSKWGVLSHPGSSTACACGAPARLKLSYPLAVHAAHVQVWAGEDKDDDEKKDDKDKKAWCRHESAPGPVANSHTMCRFEGCKGV